MTAAMAARFVKRGKRYYLDGEPLPSVTTILREGFPAPALVGWAMRETAGAAVDWWDELAALSVSERLHRLERAAYERRDRAALRGTEIHDLGERLVHGERVDVPDAYLGPVQAYARWLDEWQVEPTLTERPVVHIEHGWAGTPDLRAILRGGDDWLLDLKTGRGIYDDHALQLAAYAHAQYWLDDARELQEWTPPARCAAVHVLPDAVELRPVDAGDRSYRVFRHAAVVAAWRAESSTAYKERRPWPIGPAMTPPAA